MRNTKQVCVIENIPHPPKNKNSNIAVEQWAKPIYRLCQNTDGDRVIKLIHIWQKKNHRRTTDQAHIEASRNADRGIKILG